MEINNQYCRFFVENGVIGKKRGRPPMPQSRRRASGSLGCPLSPAPRRFPKSRQATVDLRAGKPNQHLVYRRLRGVKVKLAFVYEASRGARLSAACIRDAAGLQAGL
jgi:hypothetical protein